jgi:Flp pilus assembly pilin Flp
MNNKGQGLVEYSLILLLIAVVVMLAVRMLGGDLNNTYQNIDSAINNAR